ncbi:MAG: cyanophycinase [Planctomycetota bacterium]|nr:cyanophycinase [Planctomycetota bacterium]
MEPPKDPVPNQVVEKAEYETRFPVPGIGGALVLAGRGEIPIEVLEGFFELAGGKEANFLVLCDDRHRMDSKATLVTWRALGVSSIQLMAALQEENDGPGYSEVFESVQGIWIDSTFDLPWNKPQLAESLRAFLDRGGVIGADRGSARWLTDMSWWPRDPNLLPRHDPRLLPGAVLSCRGLRSEKYIAKAFSEHAKLQGRFTIGLADKTALFVRGRRSRIVGEGDAIFGLSPSANRDLRLIRAKAGDTVDLIALSRAAVARTGEEFPAKKMPDPVVESGTLFIGGGGPMPEAGMKRFIEASGGPDALIVVIPTAIGSPGLRAIEFGGQNAQRLRNHGANNVVVLHTFSPTEADTDEFVAPLRKAGGIWFTGGRQWNLVDAYRGTKAHELMHDVLARGGAIGGSSAGASIQAEYMVRGHPLGNTVMMAEGYEKGLGFFPGVAIDQHFAQRNRFADLASVKHAFPQLLCFGLDEQTMLIVKESVVEIVGPNNVAMYDEPVPDDYDGTEYRLLKPGDRYDLIKKRFIEDK